jgi:hypothetical protein
MKILYLEKAKIKKLYVCVILFGLGLFLAAWKECVDIATPLQANSDSSITAILKPDFHCLICRF